jgi:hypothetical protein
VRNNERLPLGFVVKEQVGLRQMLVCYGSILTGESRGYCESEDARGRPLLEKREKWRTHGLFRSTQGPTPLQFLRNVGHPRRIRATGG